MMKSQEVKQDVGKIDPCLVPTEAIIAIARVCDFGAKKYYPGSWKLVDVERYVSAAYRHLLAMVDDLQSIDAESGLPHYMHFLCNAAFIAALLMREEGKE